MTLRSVPGIRFPTCLVLLALAAPLMFGPAARAADEGTQANEAVAGGTIAAVPPDAAATASVRDASASVMRPAPMPGDTLAAPRAPGDASDDDGSGFHPEIIGMRDNSTGGALSTASADYDHAGRFRPAGGMGLTIPMQ